MNVMSAASVTAATTYWLGTKKGKNQTTATLIGIAAGTAVYGMYRAIEHLFQVDDILEIHDEESAEQRRVKLVRKGEKFSVS
jgi:ammonia channel protein AmtB